jgi:hypothetical protein
MKLVEMEKQIYPCLGMFEYHRRCIKDAFQALSYLKSCLEEYQKGIFTDPYFEKMMLIGRSVPKRDFNGYLKDIIEEITLPDDIESGFAEAERVIEAFQSKFLKDHGYVLDMEEESRNIIYLDQHQHLQNFGERKIKHFEVSFFVVQLNEFKAIAAKVLQGKEPAESLLLLL